MLLPADVRELSKHLAKRPDVDQAMADFLKKINEPEYGIRFDQVRSLVNRGAEQQADRHRKSSKSDKSAG
jgi:hypothetical protein